MAITGDTDRDGYKITQSGNNYGEFMFNSNRSSAGGALGIIRGEWNSSEVASIYLSAGDDTTNKDDGQIKFYTSAAGGSIASRMEILNNGNVKVTDGDLVIGTSGHGIDFSAQTAASGMSAELLDHYEEGSWTPQISEGGTAFTVNSSGCQYTRVGALVFICFDLTQSNGGPITGIYGLPFGVFKHSTFQFGYVTNTAGGGQGTSDITGGRVDFGNYLVLHPAGGSNSQQLASGQRVIGSACYITNS